MTFSKYARENGFVWLPPKIVARLMQCSIEHVYDLAKSGRIPYIKDGRNVRFRPEDLDAYEKHYYGKRYGKSKRRRNGTVPEKGQ